MITPNIENIIDGQKLVDLLHESERQSTFTLSEMCRFYNRISCPYERLIDRIFEEWKADNALTDDENRLRKNNVYHQNRINSLDADMRGMFPHYFHWLYTPAAGGFETDAETLAAVNADGHL